MNKLFVNEVVDSISHTHKFKQKKLYAINTSDILEGKFLDIPLLPVNELKGQFKKTIKKDDILFSEIRPANKRYAKVVIDDTDDYVVSTKLMVLRKKTDKVDLDYFYYWLTNTSFLNVLQSRAENRIGSFPQITFDLLSEYSLPIPDLSKQKKIARILSAIDEKIENNNAINTELEAIVKTIYDYWFLQFEFPDENGKPYKSSGGKMIWNEELKQDIPARWELTYLSEIADMQMKSIIPDKSKKFKHYSIPAFDDGCVPVSENGTTIDSNKYLVPNNAILVSKLNPHFKRIWNVGEVDNTCICSTEFMPFLSLTNQKEYLYSVLNSASFYKYMVQSSSSSTGSRKRMQPELCMEFKFASPTDSKLIDDYCEKVSAALDRIIENKKENQELASLRDFLLPLLMNGQVTFKGE